MFIAEVLLQTEEQSKSLLETKLLKINESVSLSNKCLILLIWISLLIQLATVTVLRMCSGKLSLSILAGILLKPGALLEGKLRITLVTSFSVTGWNSNCSLCTGTLEVAQTFGSKVQVWSFGQLVGFKTYKHPTDVKILITAVGHILMFIIKLVRCKIFSANIY